MNSSDNLHIIERFFIALDALIKKGTIRGKKTFADRYGINRRNFWKLEKENRTGLFNVAWLSYLVTDYGVSAEWLLTGEGDLLYENQKNHIS